MLQTRGSGHRREDYAPLTGHAHYVDDLRLPERPSVLHMMVIRSPYAHADVTGMHLAAAQAQPGVIAAFTGAELVQGMPALQVISFPGLIQPERYPMATDRVRFVGDPVAILLAESLVAAEDARDLVEVDYDLRPAVINLEAAIEPDAPRLYNELASNIAFARKTSDGDLTVAFAQADRIVRLSLTNQRLAPSSLEPRACLFDYDPQTAHFSAWVSSQSISRVRDTLVRFLGLDPDQISIHNADVGGAFGAKNAFVGEEIIAALLALKFGRPVKWIEQRSENLQAQTQGRGQASTIEAAVKNDGLVLGLRVNSLGDLGAFLLYSTALVPNRISSLLSGPYLLPAVETWMRGVLTTKVPTAAYRGAGRPEATYILERTMDRIAHELQLDPAEVRRRNFIPPFTSPHQVITGAVYDSGNYQAALERALELADYSGWRTRQQAARQEQPVRLLGIGIASFVEISGDMAQPARPNLLREAVTVSIQPDGSVLVQSTVAHNGQGYFTTFAQIVASSLNVPEDQVQVQLNDSALPGYSFGTYGSRITQVTGSALWLAAEALKEKALQLAGQLLEAAPTDLYIAESEVKVRGVPGRAVPLGELARIAQAQPEMIEHEPPNPFNGVPITGLAAWRDASPLATYSSGTHLAVVEVDQETGEITFHLYISVDDCGRVLNYELAEAQVHGGLAQGIGQAIYEEVRYADDGQLLSGTLMDYALPNASMLPAFISDWIETQSPFNPLGVKGVGEAGCVGGPPAIVNAVLDALAPLGIKAIDMPLTPEKIWTLIQKAQQTLQA